MRSTNLRGRRIEHCTELTFSEPVVEPMEHYTALTLTARLEPGETRAYCQQWRYCKYGGVILGGLLLTRHPGPGLLGRFDSRSMKSVE